MITFQNAKLGYPGTITLDNVNLRIPSGSFVVLGGPNGAGKTTLLKTAAGLLQPLGGSVRTHGARFGYIAQMDKIETSLPMTALEVVETGAAACLSLWQSLWKRQRGRSLELLKVCRADSFARQIFWELSGGQRQRVLIARALAVNPNCLLLDEPTTGIDHPTEQAVAQLLQKLRQEQGMTIMLITHEPWLFRGIATHFLSVEDGKARLMPWKHSPFYQNENCH